MNGGTDSDFGVRLSGADGDLAMAGLAAIPHITARRGRAVKAGRRRKR